MIGITFFSIVPVRREPTETGEMVSQLLFGETFDIVEQTEKWVKIITHWDHYSGWIDSKMFIEISVTELKESIRNPRTITTSVCTKIVDEQTRYSQLLPAGSVMYNFDIGKQRTFFRSKSFLVKDYDHSMQDSNIIDIAKQFMNAPYLWGGRTYFGIDCSGFSQLVYKLMDIPLPRDAKDQAMKGEPVNMVHEIKPGDLAFFDNEEGDIVHVGILIDNKTIIHASGCVRIDRFDQQGIFNEAQEKYTHKLRMIKRIKS